MGEEIRRTVRVKLAEAGVPLSHVARDSGFDYGRLQRVLGNYAKPQPGEIEAILAAIERASRGNRAEA